MLHKQWHFLPVPMAFRVLIERLKHYRQNDFYVVANKIAEILVVPEVKRSFCHLWYSSVNICLRGKDPTNITWKCGLATDFASWLNNGSCTFANSPGSITSKISSTSLRNITSFVLFTLGQYRNRPNTTCVYNKHQFRILYDIGLLLLLGQHLFPGIVQCSMPVVDGTCSSFLPCAMGSTLW